jgi:Domain of unknown function (DUF4175)
VPFLNRNLFFKHPVTFIFIPLCFVALIAGISSGYLTAIIWPQNSSLSADGAQLAFSKAPTISHLKTIEISYTFANTLRFSKLFLSIEKEGDKTGEKYGLSLAINNNEHNGSARYDLTPSKFAGETVSLKLIGYTQEGKEIISSPVKIRLPEREFSHPAARKIIAIRKHIWQDLSALSDRADELHDVTRQPADLGHNLTVFVALRSAVWRLRQDEAWQDATSTTDLLWEAALDLERSKKQAKADTQA